MPDFEASITIDAPPNHLYALVSNLPRLGEWSPECTRVTWIRRAPSTPPGTPTAAAQTPGTPPADTQATSTPNAGLQAPGTPAAATPSTSNVAPGARFIGFNRVGAIRWFTQGVIVDAEPGRRFSFRIHFGPIPISFWSYSFEPTPTGCQVTESWTDHRPGLLRRPFNLLFGNRAARTPAGIHHTLSSLKSAAESALAEER